MANPSIYKVWFMKYTAAWYKLSVKEQNDILTQNAASLKQVGAESLMVEMSVWSDENWMAWGVEKYPNIEAVQKHSVNLYKENWFQYVDSKTYLGSDLPQTLMLA